MADTNPYRAQWDEYIKGWGRTRVGDGDLPKESWPGDEWARKPSGSWYSAPCFWTSARVTGVIALK